LASSIFMEGDYGEDGSKPEKAELISLFYAGFEV
jgi:hypothetical protein